MKNLSAHAALIGMCLVWGLGFVFVKFALRELPAVPLVLMRFAIAGTCFGAFLASPMGPRPNFSRQHVVPLLAGAFTGIAAYQILVTWGLEYTTASVAGVLNAASAVFALILGTIFLREELTRGKMVGVPIAIAGVVVTVLWGTGKANLELSNLFGPLLVTAGMFGWAACSVILKPLLERYPHAYVSGMNIVIGGLMLLPMVFTLDLARLASLSWFTWLSLFYLGAISTGVGQALYYYGLSRLDASQAVAYLYLLPFTNAVAAAALLGESITLYLILGGVLIIAGIAIANRSPKGRVSLGDSALAESAPVVR